MQGLKGRASRDLLRGTIRQGQLCHKATSQRRRYKVDNDSVVMAAGAAMVAVTLFPTFKSPETIIQASTYKRIWAAGMLTLFLAGMSSVVPEVTGPLALSLILLAVVKSEMFGKTKTATK